jgi:hypothetical protein
MFFFQDDFEWQERCRTNIDEEQKVLWRYFHAVCLWMCCCGHEDTHIRTSQNKCGAKRTSQTHFDKKYCLDFCSENEKVSNVVFVYFPWFSVQRRLSLRFCSSCPLFSMHPHLLLYWRQSFLVCNRNDRANKEKRCSDEIVKSRETRREPSDAMQWCSSHFLQVVLPHSVRKSKSLSLSVLASSHNWTSRENRCR